MPPVKSISSPALPTNETAEIDVEFPCPFCRLQAGVTKETTRGRAVLHAIPMCREFGSMTADEFMERAFAKVRN